MSLCYYWLIDGELVERQWGCHSMLVKNVIDMVDKWSNVGRYWHYKHYNVIYQCDGNQAKIFTGSGHCWVSNHDAEIVLLTPQIAHYQQLYQDAIARQSRRAEGWKQKADELISKQQALVKKSTHGACYDEEIASLVMHLYHKLPPVTQSMRQHEWIGKTITGLSIISHKCVAGKITKVFHPYTTIDRPAAVEIRDSPTTIDYCYPDSLYFVKFCPECGSSHVQSDESLGIDATYSDCKFNCMDCNHKWQILSL